MSFRAIHIDYSPRVVFQESPEPLISRKSQQELNDIGSRRPDALDYQSSSYSPRRDHYKQSFSINDLAPSSRQQFPMSHQPPTQPPTPPPDEDDDGAMDWTPTQRASFKPASLYRPSPKGIQQIQPTPFRGHLPADVVSMEHRLRNPPNKPSFHKASEATKQNFFRSPKRNLQQDYDNASDTGTEYEASVAEHITPGPARFADPRLRLQSGQSDTGLERLLANGFSLEDEPQEVRALKQQANSMAQQLSQSSCVQWHRLPLSLTLMVSYLFWTYSLMAYQPAFQFASLLVTFAASVRSLLLMAEDGYSWSGSDSFLYILELLASVALIWAVRQSYINPSFLANQKLLISMASKFIALMAVQEFWQLSIDLRLFWRAHRGSSSSAPVDPTSPLQQEPHSSLRDPPVIEEEIETPTVTSGNHNTVTQSPFSRSEGSKKRKSLGSGFGGLSLDSEETVNYVDGLGSLRLGQPRRKNRDGMW